MREAITAASFTEGDDTINFSTVSAHGLNGGTVLLTQGQLSIPQSVTIDATMLTNGITIDAGGDSRIFNITDPTSGSAPPLVTLKGLTLTGGEPSGQFENGGAIFSTARLEILGCTIEENDAYTGGGIHIDVAGDSSNTERQVLTIIDSVIQNNTAEAGGGIDIDADDTSDRLSITRTTISNNHALATFIQGGGAGGGGIYALLYGAHLEVTESTITGNSTAALIADYYAGGGGLYAALHESASLTVDNTVVHDNHATSGNGGGILALAFYVSEPDPNQRAMTITRSTISENKANDRGGGLFLFNQEGTEVLVQESRVTGNEVPSNATGGYLNGGGIYAFVRNFIGTSPKPKWTITGSTVDSNTAPQKGGGIFVRSNFNGDFIATNSTISGNESGGAGGGMYISHDLGDHSVDAWLRNLTITQNVSADGGGVAIVDEDDTRVRIANSIISENFDHDDDPNNLDGRVYIPHSTLNLDEFTHNLIGGGSTVLDLDGSVVASTTWDNANISSDAPLLDELADNGGPTPTHRLRYEPLDSVLSPAIDHGSNALAEDPLTNVDFETDQRGTGFPRIINLSVANGTAGSVDIGAYEVASALICVSTAVDELDSDLSDGDFSLREAVKYAVVTAPDPTTICLPAGDYSLTISGSSGYEQGDLDIVGTEDVSIVGAGPGLSIIRSNGLTTKDRIFDVDQGAKLTVSHVTLKQADTPNGSSANGGAIRVRNEGILKLSYSAVVGNDTGSSGSGGAIYFGPDTTGAIEASVITVNTAGEQTGGIYLEDGDGEVTIESTIVANNSLGESTAPDIHVGSGRTLDSQGNNRFTTAPGGSGVYVPGDGDYEGSVDYVVTSIVDKYDGNYDAKNLSLRDAIDKANTTAGSQEIWLPAWNFVLTIGRGSNVTDTSVAYGDLDIGKDAATDPGGSLTIRGINGSTSVAWAAGLSDKVFEQLGDYNGDGFVNTADGVVLGKNVLEADGDDDQNYTNDQGDEDIYDWNFNAVLTLDGISIS